MSAMVMVNTVKLLYSKKEAAAQLSISERTLYSLIRHGAIKGKRIGSRILLSKHEIERFARGGNHDVVDPDRKLG